MKKSAIFIFCFITAQITFSQGVGIGTTTPDASAKLEVSSTTQGMLVPRMTTAQRTAISSPASGLLVFDMTTNSFWFKGSSTWVELKDSVNTEVHRNGPTMIYTGLTDNVGVGVIAPSNKLDINLGAPRTGTHSTGRPLYVTGTIGNDNNGIEFRHANATQGIGFGYNTIYAAGSDAVQDLGMKAKGASGNLLFSTNGIERMRVSGGGNVGIGTSSPFYPLHVLTGDGFGIMQQNGGIFLGTSTTSSSGGSASFGTYNAHPLHLFSNYQYSQMVLIPSGNVGIGLDNPLQKLHVNGNLAVNNNVAIGITDPHAPLQFSNDLQNRKIVLVEGVNNDNQFYGFGVNLNHIMRYQVSNTDDNHVFYAGTSSTTSAELMRIQGNGNVGIGTSTPTYKLQVKTGEGYGISHTNGTIDVATYLENSLGGFIGTKSNHSFQLYANDGVNQFVLMPSGYIGIGVSTPNAMLEITRGTAPYGSLQVDGTSYNSHFNYGTPEDTYIRGGKPGAKVIINDFGDFGNVGIGTANPLQKLHVGGKLAVDNNVGIGNTDPHAPLQFSNDIVNRKIVLYEGNNNDNQYYGFGINGGILRYQVSNPGDNHVFYASAASGTSSNELMRIRGDGRVGIGTSVPGTTLEIARGTAPNGTLQIDGTTFASAFNSSTSEDTYIRGGKAGSNVILNDGVILGNVGIGNTLPTEKLDVYGNAIISGSLKIGYERITGGVVNVSGLAYGSASCNCPAGKFAIGGGFIETNAGTEIIKSYANGDASWTIYMYNTNTFTTQLQAFVVCARLAN